MIAEIEARLRRQPFWRTKEFKLPAGRGLQNFLLYKTFRDEVLFLPENCPFYISVFPVEGNKKRKIVVVTLSSDSHYECEVMVHNKQVTTNEFTRN